MIRYIDEHKDRFGVEPIVAVLRDSDAGFLSVSGYYAAKVRPWSARAVRDEALKTRIAQIHAANYGVYGVRKMHAAARRDGLDVGRDQVGRLMRELGLQGVRRGLSAFVCKSRQADVENVSEWESSGKEHDEGVEGLFPAPCSGS